MKLTLKREVMMERWQVVGTLGFAQKRPEIVSILALAEEVPNGILTGVEVARKLLADRPAVVGDRLLEVCRMMRLVERVEHPSEGWVLTELGRRALKNQEVPAPQRGEFDVWLLGDMLHREVIVRVRATEQEPPTKVGERIAPSVPVATQEIPHRLQRSQGKIVRPPLRVQGDASEVYVFEFSPQGRCLERDQCQLTVELEVGGCSRFDVMMDGRQSSFAPAAKLPSLSDALRIAGRIEAEGPLKVAFRTLSDEERRSARRVVELDGLTMPDVGEFTHVRLSDVALVPASQTDADEWAVWRLADSIRGYVWPKDYERHVRAVREFAVKEGWSFDPTVPTQAELAQQFANRPVLARYLLVPLDWQQAAAPDSPVLILSGCAARATQGREIVEEWGAGAARVYVLGASEAKELDGSFIDGLGGRTVARRVRQPDDVWLRMGTDGRFGQRWHPAPKPKSKTEKTKTAPDTAHAGEWRDIPDDELLRITGDLKTAFWNRPTQELQPDGGWVAVKATAN